MSDTTARRREIRRILETRKVESQSELLELLERSGFDATQPVLSRDLRALKVAKRDGAYQLLESDQVTPLESLKSLLRGVAAAGPHIVVVRCEPGAASAVARALDAEKVPGLVGSVAGDDTVFVAVAGPRAGRGVQRRVVALLG